MVVTQAEPPMKYLVWGYGTTSKEDRESAILYDLSKEETRGVQADPHFSTQLIGHTGIPSSENEPFVIKAILDWSIGLNKEPHEITALTLRTEDEQQRNHWSEYLLTETVRRVVMRKRKVLIFKGDLFATDVWRKVLAVLGVPHTHVFSQEGVEVRCTPPYKGTALGSKRVRHE